MRFIIIGILLLAPPAMAQSTPPPLPSKTQSAGEQVGQLMFDAAEKLIIEKFFGRTATQQSTSSDSQTTTQRVVKTVIDTVTGEKRVISTEPVEIGRERPKAWKEQKSKGKGKDRGKGKQKGLPPGLAKRKTLPPGLQKQLELNGRLPPGLAKRDLPLDLESQLPPVKPGTDRIIAGQDVVLIHQATGVVLDILKDVVLGGK